MRREYSGVSVVVVSGSWSQSVGISRANIAPLGHRLQHDGTKLGLGFKKACRWLARSSRTLKILLRRAFLFLHLR